MKQYFQDSGYQMMKNRDPWEIETTQGALSLLQFTAFIISWPQQREGKLRMGPEELVSCENPGKPRQLEFTGQSTWKTKWNKRRSLGMGRRFSFRRSRILSITCTWEKPPNAEEWASKRIGGEVFCMHTGQGTVFFSTKWARKSLTSQSIRDNTHKGLASVLWNNYHNLNTPLDLNNKSQKQ